MSELVLPLSKPVRQRGGSRSTTWPNVLFPRQSRIEAVHDQSATYKNPTNISTEPALPGRTAEVDCLFNSRRRLQISMDRHPEHPLAHVAKRIAQMPLAQTLPATLPRQSHPLPSTSAAAVSIPWTIWLIVAGWAVIVVGGTWDFAWHMSIGRETFWTPPHILIQMGALLIGIGCAYPILATTFAGATPARAASVKVLGLHGPGGAFLGLWGSLAMVASAPFDNWWHNAYGLDVKIVTPPHLLLTLGGFAAIVGVMTWMTSIMNRSEDALRGRLKWLFLFVGSIGFGQMSVMITEPTSLTSMHTATCYLAAALALPSWLIAPGWGSAHRWGCTIMAAIYTGVAVAAEWLTPLFPAQPKLGPVYHNVTHLVPSGFPLLLIVPAIVADLLLQRLKQRSSWITAVWVGPAFVLSFLAVQWPFASFLISPAARNWIFGTAYFAYSDPAGYLYDPYKFDVAEKTIGAFLLTMAAALVASIVTTRFGLAWGDWMRRVRR
jgi:hypothetical protein